jgi:hypothetical protein
VHPCPVEVDGVHQHQPGHGVDAPRWNEIADLALGVLLDPGVDRQPGCFGRLDVVDDLDGCRVPAADQLEELVPERVTRLGPQRVRHPEHERLVDRREVSVELRPDLVHSVFGERDVQHRGHLLRGQPASACMRHCEGGGDRVRRQERVDRRGRQLVVQVEGEGGVGIGHPSQRDRVHVQQYLASARGSAWRLPGGLAQVRLPNAAPELPHRRGKDPR